MPNWCKNGLHVRGEANEVKVFLDKLKRFDDGGYSIISALVPCPPEMKEINSGSAMIEGVRYDRWTEVGEGKDRVMTAITPEREVELKERFGARDWYEWEVANWGGKWGDCDTKLEEQDEDHLYFAFDSAWGSPHKAFDTIAGMFPALRFNLKYGQGETEFEGYVIWRNGKRFKQDSWEWKPFNLDDDYELEEDE